MSTHNICFYAELEKIIPELSSNTPPQQVLSLTVGVLQPSQPNGIILSEVSLPNHTFTGQA